MTEELNMSKRVLALLLCALTVFQLAACTFQGEGSILQRFDRWLKDSGYGVTTTVNPDGTATTTLTPPGTTVPTPTSVSSLTPTTTPVPTTVPSVTPTTKPVPTGPSGVTPGTTTGTIAPTVTTTKPTTTATTTITTKPTTTATTATTTKATTATTTAPVASHTVLPYTQRYLYSLLTEQEKGWYRAIDTAVNSLADTVSLGVNLMENARYHIYFIYIFDNPEHFYLGGQVSYSSNGMLYMSYSDGTTNCYRGGAVQNLTDTMRANIRSRKAGFDAEVARIVSAIPVDIPAVEKERMIYDRLLIDMCYNEDAANNNLWDGVAQVNWTAYGGIIHKTGVCEAYAEAFQTLCYAVGINCTGVVGTVPQGGHKWSAVQLDGEWYACDVTFDDPIFIGGGGHGTANFHAYFNLTSAQMSADGHATTGSDYPGPNCTGTKYSYTNYFG